ncbi:hypothetical protein [Streptomyces sp. NPDC056672]|uniref:hypothetical protein n=1 Tax=Streptomyces sp. NPDC056672 TaxID=3345906 RepID=UPI0036A0D196
MRDRCTEETEVGPALQEEWGRCRCELSRLHDGDHAIYLGIAEGEEGFPEESDWGFWDDRLGVLTVRSLTDCKTFDAREKHSCTLYQGHPGHHSFEIFDPVEVALQAMADQMRMHVFGPQVNEPLPPL